MLLVTPKQFATWKQNLVVAAAAVVVHVLLTSALKTVDNHGNTEITETVIFVKCRECRDFAKMP